MTPAVVFALFALGSGLVSVLLWLEIRRTHRSLPRLLVTEGVVRELETVLTDRNAGSVKSTTLVQVDFHVQGKAYCCRTLQLFAGNRHVGDVGKRFDFQPGRRVGVYYDPVDPRRSALIVDKPRYDTVVAAVGGGLIFVIMAVLKA